jgi:putative addiction module component (TIGR02574 family)
MSGSADATLEGFNAEERLMLIHALWDSLSDEETAMTGAQREELERRLSTFGRDKAHAVSWDDLKAELKSRAG